MSAPPQIVFSGRFLLCLLLSIVTLSACSTKSIYGVPESEELLQRFVADQRPPILLRVWSRTPTVDRREIAGDPGAEATRTFGDFISFGAFGGYGGLLFMAAPSVLGYYGTYFSVERDNASMKECIGRLDTQGQDIPELVRTAFRNEPISSVFERELHSSFIKNGLRQPTTLISVADVFVTQEDMRRTEFVEAQKHSPNATLLVGDVFQKLEWGLYIPERRCGLRLSFKLDLNAVEIKPTTERPLVTTRTIEVSKFLESKDFQNVSENPQLLRAWVSDSVNELTEKIAKLYSR
jgi:hypothetical protein